jgi:hypothetical protein
MLKVGAMGSERLHTPGQVVVDISPSKPPSVNLEAQRNINGDMRASMDKQAALLDVADRKHGNRINILA